MKKFNILIISLILASLLACNSERLNEQPKRAKQVTVMTATKQRVSTPLITSGKLSSKTEIKLSFKTGGVIENIYVKEGQSVREGDLLARLNLSEINATKVQAELAFEKAQRDYQRIENLYNDSVATLENLQDAKTGLKVAEATLDIVKFNLRYSSIIAPSNGRILLKLAEENEIVGQGQPLFLFGSSAEEWVVKASLTDRDIVHVELGYPAIITFDAFPTVEFQAIVSEVGKAADPYTGTFEVELSLLPSDYQLVSGFIARTAILPPDAETSLQVPIDALVEAEGNTCFVFVYLDGMAEKRQVKTSGPRDQISLLEGVVEGEQIVVEGAQYLKDGDEVIISK